nr:MAG TPA: hypothetical protein [Caudoviricetes sp.]
MKISTKMLIATIISAISSITFYTIRVLVPVLEKAFLPLGITSLVVFFISFFTWIFEARYPLD